MLIRPDGAALWNENASVDEPLGTFGAATKRETGDKVTKQSGGPADLRGRKLYWKIPDNFCVHCEDTNVSPDLQDTGTVGVFEFSEPMPHLHMVPGDIIMYRVCGKCWDHERYGCNPRIYDAGYQRKRFNETVQETKQRVIETYIKSLILRGEKPVSTDHGWSE